MSVLQVVPWYNKQEWINVYEYAYSNNPELQRKACEIMSVWESRMSNVCMGVECTHAALHALLYETKINEDGSPIYEDFDFRCVYSTVLMRFLNRLQDFSDKTLYQIAEQHKIPDWIVNMRHETAHGNTLPPPCLLKEAINFIYVWLNKNYWEREMVQMTDVYIEPPVLQDNRSVELIMEKLLYVWKYIKLFQLGGFATIEDVPDSKEFRDELVELKSVCGQQETNPKKVIVLGKFSNYILNCIEQMLRKKSADNQHAEKILIKLLLTNQGFLPTFHTKKKHYKTIIRVLLNIWEEIIVEIQKHGLILDLLQALLEIANDCSDSRCIFAAWWIRCITTSLKLNNKEVYVEVNRNYHFRVVEEVSQMLSSGFFTAAVIGNIMAESFPEFKESLTLEPLSFLGRNRIQKFLEGAVYSPTVNTLIFIKSFLDLMEPPLQSDTKMQIRQLVKLYTMDSGGNGDNEDTPMGIMTSETLEDVGYLDDPVECVSETVEDVGGDCEELPKKMWTLYSGAEDWSKCALGRAPWQ